MREGFPGCRKRSIEGRRPGRGKKEGHPKRVDRRSVAKEKGGGEERGDTILCGVLTRFWMEGREREVLR